MENAFLALIAAALLVLIASATALVNGTRALSVSPTSPAMARDVDQFTVGHDRSGVPLRR
ncbi:hypothetical protein ACVI1J_001815 [Bradyrhizobium diazoefficiens]